ncbi:uncharacterized protein RCC_09360 [Ramularia collo-cygni]|uniref:Uncharacterized protein n=1 Tax=Ramularia collo-cygni TaxID=112498 RepID=A0A2D3V2Q1_9PEZI|nr:uncharacterized protein RCC_09360 [Ramularia collo-cygni]CZT23646.1 uncharacterized protein RCC_09360 [Ramularia collo-cygni]
MSDHSDQPFDPNAGMFLAPVENENTFAKTPANVTNDFIEEARQNAATAAAAELSEVMSEASMDRMQDNKIPHSIPPSSTAVAATTLKKRKRITIFRVTNADEQPGAQASSAVTTTPAANASEAPFSSPNALPPTKKRKRNSTKKQMNARVIPRSLDECDDADKELITMREAGHEWKAIRARWAEMTGETTATSTLPNRYSRLKSNFTVIKEEDNGLLIAAKRDVEESFENQKWNLISRVVAEKGGETYAAIVLKRQYKNLMVNAGAVPPPGVLDPDFTVELPESDGE